MTNKKLISFLVFIYFINILFCEKIMAIDVTSDTDGNSYGSYLPPCNGTTKAGCGYHSEDFRIRVTLVTANKKMVAGTKTVEFTPNNPYRTDNGYTAYNSYSTSAINSNGFKVKKPNEAPIYNDNTQRRYLFVGSSIANGQTLNDMSELAYKINMDFGYGTAVEESFTNYKNIRKKFMDYATNPDKKEIKVAGESKPISFIDFFLKVSGFTKKITGKDIWRGTSNAKIRTELERQKESDGKGYYLLIEPVYAYTVWTKNGKEEHVKGTSKQLATMVYNNFILEKNTNKETKPWYWVPFYENIAYNHYCNFIEMGTGLFDTVKSNVCSDINNFKFYVDDTTPKLIPNSKSNPFLSAISNIVNSLQMLVYRSKNIFLDMANKNSNIGVNVINISDVLPPEPESQNITVDCNVSVNNCTNNSFTFSTSLESNDIAACIFPKYEDVLEEELENIADVYTYGNGSKKLWCYDDITYDFSDLHAYFQKNEETKLNQLLEIPNGKLTVNRTCYSKSSSSATYKNAVFETEPNNINNMYEKSFSFKFNGKTFKFVLDPEKYEMSGNTRKTSNFTVTSTKVTGNEITNSYYKYTSVFNYDYVLNAGEDSANASIGIKDLSIFSYKDGKTSINFETSGNSQIISNPAKNNWTTYTNTLTPNTITKFGLSTSLFNSIKKSKKTSNNITTTKLTISGNNEPEEVEDLDAQDLDIEDLDEPEEEPIIIYQTNKYTMKKNAQNNTCSFNTHTDNISYVFRVISLSNPFPARDGTSRIPANNWINKSENNVYAYIQNNRNVTEEKVYNKAPLYTINLTPKQMVEIREYNKKTPYNSPNITCETGTGRMCIDNYIRKYVTSGTCKNITAKEITNYNEKVKDLIAKGCDSSNDCLTSREEEVKQYDTNGDKKITESDYLKASYYTCADKDYTSGG